MNRHILEVACPELHPWNLLSLVLAAGCQPCKTIAMEASDDLPSCVAEGLHCRRHGFHPAGRLGREPSAKLEKVHGDHDRQHQLCSQRRGWHGTPDHRGPGMPANAWPALQRTVGQLSSAVCSWHGAGKVVAFWLWQPQGRGMSTEHTVWTELEFWGEVCSREGSRSLFNTPDVI